MKTAVVLSGGGGKGAYQIGVWKALRKLGINYDIVTGTSVGALNGVLMVQQDYQQAVNLWSNIDYDFIFSKKIDKDDEKIYLTYFKEFIKSGGMDVTNLEKAIDKYFNPKVFFTSPIDFGLVIYNLSKMKAEMIDKKDLTPINLRDYVVASSTCYPAIKIKKINDEKYIDGGFYDNLPINLAIELGADRLIVVDLKAPGIKQKIKDKDKTIINISPNNDIGSFLKFDKITSKRNMKYGYNDALKVFGKLIGQKYTFYIKPYNFFIKRINKNFEKNINNYLNSDQTLKEQLKSLIHKIILRKDFKNNNLRIIEVIEFIGDILKLDDSKVYFLNYYNYLIKKKFREIQNIDKKLFKEKITKKEVDSLLGSKYIVKYIYQILKSKDNYSEIYSLAPVFKQEFLAAVYLITIGC